MKSNWKAIRAAYYQEFHDDWIIECVTNIVTEIRDGVWPDNSPLGLYTVGDVKAIEGFYASKQMIEELIAALTGRTIRGFCIHVGLSPFDPSVAKLLEDTNQQTARCIDPIHKKLLDKFGPPNRIDEGKIADITSRAYKILNPKPH